ncbi:ABC transporter permease [Pseudarthrobacter sp. LMD1-1-1.1]|uniref:ABC transporter permease n=1 Tax=Pseudarthrobacter sp. LMD1-1-1.1 TaxID=3135242 RepID=UPI00342DAD8F
MTQVHLAQRVKPVARPRRRYGSQIRKVAILIISVLAGLVIWQVLSWQFGPALVASPAETAEAAFALLIDGTLWEAITASSYRILLGWLLGVAVGAPLGLLMGRIAVIRELAEPYIEFFRFIPPIAFVTLAVVWFGLGDMSQIVLIFYTSVFVVVINTMAGAVATDETKLRAAASLGASRFQTLYSIVLPSAVPHIVTGARLALGNSFLTIVSAEMVAADQGLGVLIWTSRNYGRIDWTFVGIITLGVIGFFFDRALRLLVSPLAKYKAKI